MRMPFTDEQLAQLRANDFETLATLKNDEVFAIYTLGRFSGQMVRLTFSSFGNTEIGVFCIDEINGEAPDFSDATLWLNVQIDSIKFSLTYLTATGYAKETYRSLHRIAEISLLKAKAAQG